MALAFATGIQHIGLPTEDLPKTIDFYKSIGFEQEYTGEGPDGRPSVCFLKLGDLVMEAYQVPRAANAPGAIEHVAINVTDIQAAWDFAHSVEGLVFLHDEIQFLPFFERGVKFFTFVGPNQERLEFNQVL